MTKKILAEIKLEHSIIQLHPSNVVQVNSYDHEFSKEDIKNIHQAIWKINGNKKAFVLLVASRYSQLEDEARKYVSTPEGNQHTLANAFVIQSLAQRILINFMIKVQRRPVPTRFFANEENALEWLMKLNQKSKEV